MLQYDNAYLCEVWWSKQGNEYKQHPQILDIPAAKLKNNFPQIGYEFLLTNGFIMFFDHSEQKILLQQTQKLSCFTTNMKADQNMKADHQIKKIKF